MCCAGIVHGALHWKEQAVSFSSGISLEAFAVRLAPLGIASNHPYQWVVAGTRYLEKASESRTLKISTTNTGLH